MPEKNKIPKTINVYEIDNIIMMDFIDFINLIQNLEKKVVFKTEEFFFTVIEGLTLGTWHYYSYDTYEEFSLFCDKLEKSDLKESIDKLRALILKIDNIQEFKEYINSKFHDKYNKYYKTLQENYENYMSRNEGGFEAFLDAKSKGFKKKSEYELAVKCGISSFDDFTEFANSSFFSSYPDKDDYQDFLKFEAGRFPDKDSYYNAKEYDFDNYSEYKYFEESGCYDKNKYEEYFKVLYYIPDINEDLFDKFLAIIKDSKEAFEDNQYGEFFRLKYIFFEKVIEILYKKLCNKQFESERPLIEDIIKEIKDKMGAKFENYEELRHWRKIRNKFSHEHYVIDRDQANQAKTFFNKFILELLEQVNNFTV